MTQRPTLTERAFEIARSGACRTVTDLRKQLRAEGYPIEDLYGPTLVRQLRRLCEDAQQTEPPFGAAST
jgi:hypothetical protein